METLVEIAKRLGIKPNAGYTAEQLKGIRHQLMDEMHKLFKGDDWHSYSSLDDAVYRLHKKVPAPENLEVTNDNILFLKEKAEENIRIHGQDGLPVSKEEDATFVWHSAKDRKKMKERFQIAIQMDHHNFQQMVKQLDKFIVKHKSSFKIPDIDHVDRSDCLNVYMSEKITPEIAKELYEIVSPCLDTKYADHLDGIPVLNQGKEISGMKMALEPQKPDVETARAIRDKFNIENDLSKPFLNDFVGLGKGAIKALYSESTGEMASRIQLLDLAYYLAGKEGKNPMSMSNYYGQKGVNFSPVDISEETEHTNTRKGEKTMTKDEAEEQLQKLFAEEKETPFTEEELKIIGDCVDIIGPNAILDKDTGATLAPMAVKKNDRKLLELLDDKKINWTLKNKYNSTLLHAAAIDKKEAALNFFVEKGMDFTQKNSEGITPLDYLDKYPELKKEIEEKLAQKKDSPERNGGEDEEDNPSPERSGGKKEEVTSPERSGGEEEESEITEEEGMSPTPEQPAPESEKAAPKGTPQAKKIAGALKGATDNFFKNVFEGKQATAEDFARDFLFNMLAFPLDAINIYLEKTYDKDEKDLLNDILKEMKNNKETPGNGGPDIEGLTPEQNRLIKGLGRIYMLAKGNDPSNTTELSQKMEQLLGKSPEEIKVFFENNPEFYTQFKNFVGEIAKTDKGKQIIKDMFPDNYNGKYTADDLIAVLTGKDKASDKEEDKDKGDDKDKKDPDKDDKGDDKDKKLPFKLPEKMDSKVRGKILSSYAKLVNSSKDENKIKAFTDFINSKGSNFQQKLEALDLIQNHRKLLEGLSNKNGDLSIKKFDKYNGRQKEDASKKLDKKNIKLAMGLLKRLEKGSKEGELRDPRGRGGRS